MAVISAFDGATGERLYMDKVWHSNTASAALSEMQRGFSEGSGWEFVLNFASGYKVGVATHVTGYKDAAWEGDSGTGTIKIFMSKIVQAVSTGGAVTPAPAPSICPYDPNLLAGDTRCVAPTAVVQVPAPATTKPPASGTPETLYKTLSNGYTIYIAGNQYHLYDPNGNGLGFYASVDSATTAAGVDSGEIPPNGQRYCLDSSHIAVWNQVSRKYDSAPCSTGACKDGYCVQPTPSPTESKYAPPETTPSTPQEPISGTEAIKYTCPSGDNIFVDPNMLRTGINPYDLCGATNLPAPGQPLTPEQQKAQDTIDAAKAVAKANAGQQLTPTEQAAVNKYFAVETPIAPKDNTGLFVAGAAVAVVIAYFLGRK